MQFLISIKALNCFLDTQFFLQKIDLTDYRSTTSNHLLAVCILVFAALVTTYAMWWCINNNLIAWETIHEELSTILVDRAKVEIIYTNYYILFYTFIFCNFYYAMCCSMSPKYICCRIYFNIVNFSYIFRFFKCKVWGHIMTEANTINNFNFGFSTHKSDILIHLSQWQYWWWFWFSIFWAMYFFYYNKSNA